MELLSQHIFPELRREKANLNDIFPFKKLKAPDCCVQLLSANVTWLLTNTWRSWSVFHVKLERTQTNGRTDRRTDRRYQTYYLPCFAVDNHWFMPVLPMTEVRWIQSKQFCFIMLYCSDLQHVMYSNPFQWPEKSCQIVYHIEDLSFSIQKQMEPFSNPLI